MNKVEGLSDEVERFLRDECVHGRHVAPTVKRFNLLRVAGDNEEVLRAKFRDAYWYVLDNVK